MRWFFHQFANTSTKTPLPLPNTMPTAVMDVVPFEIHSNIALPAAAIIAELSESARNLPNASWSLGTIQLGLDEIRKRAHELRKDLPVDNNTKAHYLLAGSGVNAENIQAELQSIKLNNHYEPSEIATLDIDIDSYVKAKKEEVIWSSIEESILSTELGFDYHVDEIVTLDWKTRKDQVCQLFGLSTMKNRSTDDIPVATVPGWTKISLGRAVLGSSSGSEFTDVDTSPPTSTEAMRDYITVVQELNRARQSGKSYNISQRFHEISISLGSDIRSKQMQDVWKILSEITGESSGRSLPERKYAHAYIDSGNSHDAIKLRRKIAAGAKQFLEKQYFENLELEISRNPMEAQLGGVPSVHNKIRASLNLMFAEKGRWVHPTLEIVNNVPIWALIYYMIRSGHLKDALEFTLSNREAFQKLGTGFPLFLQAYAESPVNSLTGSVLESIRKEFNNQVRAYGEGGSDPYKFALYKIIGRCELSKKTFPEIVRTKEDWLWLHFSLIYEDSTEVSTLYDKYTLESLRHTVTSFGAEHFDPEGKEPGLYVQILIMCGLFEQAVHYAYKFSQIEAVHLAIALTYHGLIRPMTQVPDILLHDDALNFSRLMGTYTRSFRHTDPVEAVEYISLICMNKDVGREFLKMCHEALKELVLETREFSKLLGDLRSDGSRVAGAIEQRLALIDMENVQQYLYAITEQAAIRAEEDGRIADAVLLYQLSEEYDTVVSIINKSLGEMLSVAQLGQAITGGDGSGMPLVIATTNDPAQLARQVMEVFNSNISILRKVKQHNREACGMLLTIVSAWDAFANGKYEQCLKKVGETNILTLDSTADVGMVRARTQQFQTLHQSVARNVPALLVMVMRCCSAICDQLNSSLYHNEGRHAKMLEMQGISRNCLIYAGLIQYRMPREIFVELTNLEIRI